MCKSMNYELAERLKEAGYPFRNKGGYIYRHCEGHDGNKEDWEGYMDKCIGEGEEGNCGCICHNLPTSDELIESLGKYISLTQHDKDLSGNTWNAIWNPDQVDGTLRLFSGVHGFGLSALEALANLYIILKIQKKI